MLDHRLHRLNLARRIFGGVDIAKCVNGFQGEFFSRSLHQQAGLQNERNGGRGHPGMMRNSYDCRTARQLRLFWANSMGREMRLNFMFCKRGIKKQRHLISQTEVLGVVQRTVRDLKPSGHREL